MAELFVQQGHASRAIGIYRKLVRDRPHDRAAARRLEELEGRRAPNPGDRMTFREHMQRIVEAVPGATACALMGFDGIAIDSYEIGGGELDIPTLLTEYSSATQTLRQAGQQQPLAGRVNELVISTPNLTAVMRPLNEAYFLAVVLSPGGVSGKARYMMRQVAPQLIADLS